MKRIASLWPYAAIFAVATLIIVMFLRPDDVVEQTPDRNAASEPGLYWSGELDHRLALTRISTQSRTRAAQELIAGRVSLLEAATHFRDLSLADPNYYWNAFRFAYPCPTDDERFCRHVITVVKAELVDGDPQRARIILGRLEAELVKHLENGTLVLMDSEKLVTLRTGI